MDLGAIDIKRSIVGTLGIVLAVIFIGLLGPAGLLAGLCAIFLGVLDDPAPLPRAADRRGPGSSRSAHWPSGCWRGVATASDGRPWWPAW